MNWRLDALILDLENAVRDYGRNHDSYRREALGEAREAIASLFFDAARSIDESAAREAAYATHHCESEGCAHEGEYTAKAALWADKYHRYQTALRAILAVAEGKVVCESESDAVNKVCALADDALAGDKP